MAENTQIKRGKVLVFNTTVDRKGTQGDVDLIVGTFTALNADVEICDIAKVKEIMNKVKNSDLSEYDYIAIVWGSHGTEDDIVKTPTQKYIYLRQALLTPLCKNKTLSGKLKWIITQTCRGGIKMEGVGTEEEFYDPKYYLISSSTSDGTKSWRLEDADYSFFIKILCKQILENYAVLDILSILKRVRAEIKNEFKQFGTIKQKPTNEENFGTTFSFSFCN